MTVAISTNRSGASVVYGNMTSGRRGRSRVRNDIAGYLAFVSYTGLPDLTGAYTYSPTLPMSLPLTPPGSGTRTYNVVIVKQNQFGLRSKNQRSYTITIDSTGLRVTPPPPTPIGVVVQPAVGGQVGFRAQYLNYQTDANPADSWRVWVSAGVINPATDPYTGTMPVTGPVMPPLAVGTFAPGTYNWAIALRRASDSTQSAAVTGTVVLPALPVTPAAVS